MTYAATSSNTATTAPHSNNAALRSESPYQQRTTQRDNPTQQLIKQAVDYLLQLAYDAGANPDKAIIHLPFRGTVTHCRYQCNRVSINWTRLPFGFYFLVHNGDGQRCPHIFYVAQFVGRWPIV